MAREKAALIARLQRAEAERDELLRQVTTASDFIRYVWGDVLGKSLPEEGAVDLDELRREIATMAMRIEEDRERVGALEAAARKAYSGFAALSEIDKLGHTPPRISEVAERHCDRLRAALEDNDA